MVSRESLQHIQLLVTSRKEPDIERAISPIATELSLSNSYVDEDIRTYIQRCLREDRKLQNWPEDLKTEIESGLFKGAQGMQVDNLFGNPTFS